MALKLDVLANTRQFVQEMEKAGASTEDISDSLDELKRQGVKGLDKLEGEFKNMSKAADSTSDKVDDSFRDMARSGEKTGRSIGKDMDDGFDKAKKGADDFKQEANSTAREAAASFDGSAESIGDAFQEVAANAFSGFGPAGAAAGLGIALGIGAGIAAIQTMHENTDELKKGISEMYQAAAEEGRTFLDEAQIQAEASRLLFEDRKRIREEANRLGVDAITLARAYAGDEEATNAVLESGRDILEERNEKNRENLETIGAAPQKVDLEAEAIRQVIGLLEDQQGWHEENQQAAQEVADMKKRHGEEERSSIAKTQQKLTEMINGKYVVKMQLDTSAWDKWTPPDKRGIVRSTVDPGAWEKWDGQ